MLTTQPNACESADEAWGRSEVKTLPVPHTEMIHATRFKLIHFKDVKFSPSRDLIKGLIPREGLVIVYGPPKEGKTFFLLDMMLHAALWRQYRGRRVKNGVVVYIVLEGAHGVTARIEAFRKKFLGENGETPDFFLLPTRLALPTDREQLIVDIQARLGKLLLAAIVLDTLNRSIEGSESDDKDMGAYIKSVDAIRETFCCAIIVVHHCGHEGTRPRGHSALMGAADTQISVRKKDGIVTAKLEFMKDGEAGAEIYSRLESVEIGIDEDGDPITSCVIVPVDDPPPASQKIHVKGQAKIALDQLRNAIITIGEILPPSDHILRGTRAVKDGVWREYFYKALPDDGKRDSKRTAFKRAVETLHDKKVIGLWDGWVWLVDSPDIGQRADM